MDQVRKMAKNQPWLRTIVQKGPINYKTQTRNTDMDQNKLTFQQFSNVLDFVSQQAQLTPPTKQQKFQLFQQFNDGKNEDYLVKQQYEKFVQRMFMMLSATQNN